jgi:hypothetical protein
LSPQTVPADRPTHGGPKAPWMGTVPSRPRGTEAVIVDAAPLHASQVYWYTLRDIRKVLGVGRSTIFRYLPRVPAKDKVLVTRHLSGPRTTRYWRISPNGLRILGHATGQAPYL